MKSRIFVAKLVSLPGLVIACLAGCSSVPATETVALASVECCQTVSDIVFRTIQVEELVDVALSNDNPKVRLENQVASVQALALPSGPRQGLIVFRSFFNGLWMPTATVVQPSFYFFDEQKVVLKAAHGVPLYQLRQAPIGSRGPVSGGGYFGAVAIPIGAKFVLIAPNLLAEPVPWYQGPGAAADEYIRSLTRQNDLLPLRSFVDGTAPKARFGRGFNEFLLKPSSRGHILLRVL